jgi:hypothetical protein
MVLDLSLHLVFFNECRVNLVKLLGGGK